MNSVRVANSDGVEYFREPIFPRVEATLGSNLRTPLEFNVGDKDLCAKPFTPRRHAILFVFLYVYVLMFLHCERSRVLKQNRARSKVNGVAGGIELARLKAIIVQGGSHGK
jgi:hypothetical protein